MDATTMTPLSSSTATALPAVAAALSMGASLASWIQGPLLVTVMVTLTAPWRVTPFLGQAGGYVHIVCSWRNGAFVDRNLTGRTIDHKSGIRAPKERVGDIEALGRPRPPACPHWSWRSVLVHLASHAGLGEGAGSCLHSDRLGPRAETVASPDLENEAAEPVGLNCGARDASYGSH